MTEPIQKPGRSRQDYGTPVAFIEACAARFGPIVCDLACTTVNAKAPAGYHYDKGADSLMAEWARDWPEGNLWLNPPFGDIGAWAAKCTREAQNRGGAIFLLTPASIGSNWFAKHVHRRARVLGLSPRLTFEGTKDPYPKDLMLSIFGLGFDGFDVWRWLPRGPSAADRTLPLSPDLQCPTSTSPQTPTSQSDRSVSSAGPMGASSSTTIAVPSEGER